MGLILVDNEWTFKDEHHETEENSPPPLSTDYST